MNSRILTPARLATNQLTEIQKLLRVHKAIAVVGVQVPELTEMIQEKIACIDENVTEADFASEDSTFVNTLGGIRTAVDDLTILLHRQSSKRKREGPTEKKALTPVHDWSVPIRRYTAGSEIQWSGLKLVCSAQNPLLYDLHDVTNLGAKDPRYRFRATDVLYMEVCSKVNHVHLELKCGEHMFRDVFIDLPARVEQHEFGDYERFVEKLMKDKVGMPCYEIPR
ncbi:MAG: hypothetical protein Q9211_003359 [Gyalolechia sp. 1 TL-2023]